jgi:hypothetical protein
MRKIILLFDLDHYYVAVCVLFCVSLRTDEQRAHSPALSPRHGGQRRSAVHVLMSPVFRSWSVPTRKLFRMGKKCRIAKAHPTSRPRCTQNCDGVASRRPQPSSRRSNELHCARAAIVRSSNFSTPGHHLSSPANPLQICSYLHPIP